jgi:hypothetical protein
MSASFLYPGHLPANFHNPFSLLLSLPHVNSSWFLSAKSSVTFRVCPQYFCRKFVVIHSHNMADPPTSVYWISLRSQWFIAKLFQFSTVPLDPLPSLAYRVKYFAKDFPIEDAQYSFTILLSQSRPLRRIEVLSNIGNKNWYSQVFQRKKCEE